jgi:hypothetical protein
MKGGEGMSTGTISNAWETAQEGTQQAAAALPDTAGLDAVKDFVRRHPVLSTCIVLAVAWYILGRSFPAVALSLGAGRR